MRMDAVNVDTMKHYFDMLKKTLQENKLMNSPGQIYNVDECGMPLDPKAPDVVATVGSKKVRYRSTGRKEQVTIVGCGSAAGHVIPPTIIFDAKKMNYGWTSGELPGTMYGCSNSGWITTDLFESWLTDHFLKHAVGARPLLLLLDGHSTHYQPNVVQKVREKGVVMLCLLSHTTHDAQSFDCAVFSPLKAQWRSVCHHFLQANPGKIIIKFNFTAFFQKRGYKQLHQVML